MPDMVFFGRNWDQCSDMLPLSMISPIVVYCGAMIPLAIETYRSRDPSCYVHPGHGNYRVSINVIFGIFSLQLLLEILTFFAGLIGTPLETRKRWLAEWLVLGTYANNVVQLGATIYGSWVLATFPSVPCPEDHALKPLVVVSWVLLGLSLLYFLLCFQWIPNHQKGLEATINKFRCLCSLCACLGFASALEPLRKMDMEGEEGNESSERETALVEHLAETFHIIFGDLDFTTSDRHVGLVLATALQQKQRHVHIKECLLEDKSPRGDGKSEEAVKTGPALEHCVTKKYPTLLCPSGYAQKIAPNLTAQEAADRYTGFSDRVPLGDLEEALGFFEYAVAAYYVEDQGTVATEKGKEEGKEEAKETEGSTAVAEPGALHEKPMGDAPPPMDETLSNNPAPTFNEMPTPSSDSMMANGASEPDPREINRDLYTLTEDESGRSPLQSIAENTNEDFQGTSYDLGSLKTTGDFSGTGSLANTLANSTAHSSESTSTGSSVFTPPWIEGVSRDPRRVGEDSMRPTAGRGDSPMRVEKDASGNVITRIDMGEDHDSRKSFSERARSAVGAIGNKAHDIGHKIGDIITPGHEEKDSGGKTAEAPTGRSVTQKAKDQMGGMDKSAAKAMRGEMQKGGKSDGKPQLEADDKVQSSCCCFCQSPEPTSTPLDKLDCIYSRAHNTILGTLPYMIALDWERRTVVLGVRGTSSMSDALTDAIAQPIPILPWLGTLVTEDNGGIASVHSGILASAAALNHDLEDHGILNALFSGAAVDEQAKEEHTENVASQLDDKLVAILAETPAAAAFVDAHAIQSIPVTEIPTGDISLDLTESEMLGADSLPTGGNLDSVSLPSGSSNTAGPNPFKAEATSKPKLPPQKRSSQKRSVQFGQISEEGDLNENPSAGQASQETASTSNPSRVQDNRSTTSSVNPFKEQRNRGFENSEPSLSPFGAHSNLSPFSGHAQKLGSPRGSSELSRSSQLHTGGSSSRLQTQMTSKELRNLDEEIIASAMKFRSAEQKRNQDAYDLARAASQMRSKKSVHHPRKDPRQNSFKRRASSIMRFSSMPRAMSSLPPDQQINQPDTSHGHANGRPIDVSQDVGQNREPSGNTPTVSAARSRSTIIEDAGRAMRKIFEERKSVSNLQDTRASFDVSGHKSHPARDPSPSKSEKAEKKAQRRHSIQAKRAESKRVRFEEEELRNEVRRQNKEDRRRRQQEIKIQKMQEARQKKIAETLKKAEAQMQGTFMAKVFRSQQDLKRLDTLGLAEAQAKKRADFRLKQLKQLEERKLDCRGWQLVLTGHSLGAGVAALLALKLRPRMPNVSIKCWAFCPPGGLVTAGLAEAMEPFCTSVVVGKDAVPRASLGCLSRLVDEVVVGLARGKCCKARILLRNLTSRGRAKCRRPSEYFPVDEIPDQCQEVLDQYTEGAVRRIEAIGQPTYPPGRVIYCRRLKETKTESSYDSVWVSPQDIIKEGFIISSKMLKDHLCDSVTTALEMSIEGLKSKDEKDKFRREPVRETNQPDSSDEDSDGE